MTTPEITEAPRRVETLEAAVNRLSSRVLGVVVHNQLWLLPPGVYRPREFLGNANTRAHRAHRPESKGNKGGTAVTSDQ
jgi:hypothetical protein